MDTVQTAKYVYFELTGLESDPLVAVPFVMALMGTVWRRIQDPSVIHERKAVIIDEAWSFLAHPAFFRVVDEMFRTIRKFNGFVTLATQSPLDVQQGNARKLLQTMSEVFLYRGFSVSDDFLSEDLELAPHQIEQLRSICGRTTSGARCSTSPGAGMNRILSVEIPPALYWFVTTDGQDKQWRNVFCRRFGLSEGIAHLVKACDGRTIVNGNDRIERVRRYARELGFWRRRIAHAPEDSCSSALGLAVPHAGRQARLRRGPGLQGRVRVPAEERALPDPVSPAAERRPGQPEDAAGRVRRV